MPNFVESGLDRTVNCVINLGSRPDWIALMEKNCVIFVIEKLYFVNFLDLDFLFQKNSLNCGWIWTEFWKFRTGSGSQKMTVRSSLKHTARCQIYFASVSNYRFQCGIRYDLCFYEQQICMLRHGVHFTSLAIACFNAIIRCYRQWRNRRGERVRAALPGRQNVKKWAPVSLYFGI